MIPLHGLNGQWSPFGFEAGSFLVLALSWYWLNGQWSPFGFEADIQQNRETEYKPEAKWPVEPVWV